MPIDIQEVKTFVTNNLSHMRSVKEIANTMSVSVETLRKCFRRKEHEPLSDFLTRERLNEMKWLLLKTNLRCCEICFHLGLRDDSGHKFFRRKTGMAMEEFRMQNRNVGENKLHTKKTLLTYPWNKC
jgi:YesN/AraC family two-component response regulator